MTTTKLHCELCIRYGITTPIDASIQREIEGEGINKKYLFPICQCCADMIDNDTRTPEDQ